MTSSDSRETSTVKRLPLIEVAVMQAPFIAIESPIFVVPRPRTPASMVRRTPFSSGSTCSIAPTAWMIPENISAPL